MLHATVRNRKIHVKSPTTIPQGSKNVDVLLLDLDEEWDAMSTIVCIFSNLHTEEKVKKKVITTEETKVETKKESDNTVLSTKTTTVISEEETDAEDDNKDFDETDQKVEVTETDGPNSGEITTTTKTTTIVTERPVSRTEETTTSNEMLVTNKTVSVPHEVLDVVGQMSISVVGYGDDGNAVMTTVLSDSFWEVVESGITEGDVSEEQTPTIYEQAMAAIGKAEDAAKIAKDTADNLAQDAANGKFNGRNGKDGRDGADGRDGIDGKDGANGTDGKDGKDGKSAYQYAREKGYQGTEESYADLLANVGNIDVALDAIIVTQEGYIAQGGVMANAEVLE